MNSLNPSFKPVNSLAARVIQPGIHYEFDESRLTIDHWDAPPICMKNIPKNTPDLTGVKFGRFTVIGLLPNRKSSWLVRCCCGKYEVRRAKSIKNPNNYGDRCHSCRDLAYLKKREIRRLTHKDNDVDVRIL